VALPRRRCGAGVIRENFCCGAHFGWCLLHLRWSRRPCGQERIPENENISLPRWLRFGRMGVFDGRHPDAVRYTKSAEEDVKRRISRSMAADGSAANIEEQPQVPSAGSGRLSTPFVAQDDKHPFAAQDEGSSDNLRSSVLDFVAGCGFGAGLSGDWEAELRLRKTPAHVARVRFARGLGLQSRMDQDGDAGLASSSPR